jgi:hypothetical protein
MDIHIVAFCRDNKIETVVKFTRSLHLAQLALLDAVENSLGNEAAMRLHKDFSDGALTDDCTINVNDELNLQLFHWKERY